MAGGPQQRSGNMSACQCTVPCTVPTADGKITHRSELNTGQHWVCGSIVFSVYTPSFFWRDLLFCPLTNSCHPDDRAYKLDNLSSTSGLG
eukprot:scaffold50283_cov65-Phaeocystis_antarctica.AAC.6